MMNIQIDDCRPAHALGLQHTNGNRDVVERTEPFAVIRKRVVQTAAEMHGKLLTS